MKLMQDIATSSSGFQKRSGRLPLTLLMIMFAGILIRCYNLSSILFYWDEPIHSVRIAYQPLAYVLHYNNASALFSVLIHFLMPLGKLELMARLPSLIFGILLIPLIYYSTKKYFSSREAKVAAALVAFSPFFIRFSQYSRTYATFVFFSFLMLVFFFRALKEDRIRLWIAYAAATFIAVYSHLMGFLAFSGIGLYAGVFWLKGIQKHKTLRTKESTVFLRFLAFTLAAFILAAALYSQDINVKGFLSASVDRVQNQASISSLIPYLAKKIFNEQMLLKPYYFIPMLAAIFLGLAGSLKKHREKIGFFLLYILLPFTIFLSIKPRTVNIQSAERYFIFILPVIFLIAARGIVVLCNILTATMNKIRSGVEVKPLWIRLYLVIFSLILIFGFNHQHYYLNFWRFGTNPVKKEVREHLQKNMKQDSLILFDSFPAAGHTLIANPLSKKIDLQQSENLIRNGFSAPDGKNQIMIYRINTNTLKPLSRRKIDLWVISAPDPAKTNLIMTQAENSLLFNAVQVQDSVILHFSDKEQLLGDKLHQYSRLALTLEQDKIKQKELHLMTAEYHLLYGQTEDAYQELDQATALVTGKKKIEYPPAARVYSVLDRLFGLSSEELYSLYFDWFYYQNISRFLFDLGERYHKEKEFQKARSAYDKCLEYSRKFEHRIASRLFQLANNFLAADSPADAVPLYNQAIKLNPERFIFQLFLAEALKLENRISEAEAQFRSLFSDAWQFEPTRDRIINQDPVVIIGRDGEKWRIIYRGAKGTVFAGKIRSKKKIKQVRPDRFSTRDTVTIAENELDFYLNMDKRRIKILEFETKRRSPVSFDLQINGTADKSKIILLNTSTGPDQIPFSIQ